MSRRYSGFDCAKTAQAEVTVQPGRFFDQGGAVYVRATSLVQSVVAFLPAVARRIVTVAVNGVENQVDVEERDFLINVETGETEPDAVAMTRSRDTIISFVQGSESADPQPPLLPARRRTSS